MGEIELPTAAIGSSHLQLQTIEIASQRDLWRFDMKRHGCVVRMDDISRNGYHDYPSEDERARSDPGPIRSRLSHETPFDHEPTLMLAPADSSKSQPANHASRQFDEVQSTLAVNLSLRVEITVFNIEVVTG